jgi:hypothetical protein
MNGAGDFLSDSKFIFFNQLKQKPPRLMLIQCNLLITDFMSDNCDAV